MVDFQATEDGRSCNGSNFGYAKLPGQQEGELILSEFALYPAGTNDAVTQRLFVEWLRRCKRKCLTRLKIAVNGHMKEAVRKLPLATIGRSSSRSLLPHGCRSFPMICLL